MKFHKSARFSSSGKQKTVLVDIDETICFYSGDRRYDLSEPNFENLSKAITEAVMTSDKVRKIVEEIQKDEEICPQSFMVLVLKMQVLTESLELNIEANDTLEDTPARKVAQKKTQQHLLQ